MQPAPPVTLRGIRPLTPGEWAALGLVAQALVLDAWLIRRNHEPISACVRLSPVGRLITLYLFLHLCTTVPGDPLTILGRWYVGRCS
jgi:hypothetical protein